MFHLVLNYLLRVFKVILGCKLFISRGCIFWGLLRGILILYIFVTVYICQLWGNGVTIFGKKSFANKGTVVDYPRYVLFCFTTSWLEHCNFQYSEFLDIIAQSTWSILRRKLYFSIHQIIWSRYSLSSLLLESVTEGNIRGNAQGSSRQNQSKRRWNLVWHWNALNRYRPEFDVGQSLVLLISYNVKCRPRVNLNSKAGFRVTTRTERKKNG